MLNVNNGNTLDTNPYTLLQTRNAIDGLQKNGSNPQVSRILTETRQMIDDSLAQHVPGIKMADAQFRELARQNEGLRIGVKALDSGREALRPEELQQEVLDGVNPEGLMVGPSAKTFRMQQAARADIGRQIGTKANDLVALKNIIKGEGDWNCDRMGMLFGQDRTKDALDLLDREALFATTKNDVLGNSYTAARQAAQRDLAPPAPPAFGVKEAYSAQGALGALRAAGVRTVGHVMKLIQQQAIEKRNTQIAQALTSNRPAYLEAMNLLQNMKVGAPQVQKVIEAITMDRATKGGNMTHQLLSRLDALAN